MAKAVSTPKTDMSFEALSSNETPLVMRLLERNQEQVKTFLSLEHDATRERYRMDHPTEIAALKCMDGRLNLSVMTKMPLGIIYPCRNLGGKFDIGWYTFAVEMREWVTYALRKNRDALIMCTYHFSKGDTHRGCAGYGYDTKAAYKGVLDLVKSAEDVFPPRNNNVFLIAVGIETDQDSLIFHGEKEGTKLIVADLPPKTSEADMLKRLKALYPSMKERVMLDLLPLATGNLKHVAEVKKMKRPITEVEHKEQVLAYGRGFDWLHWPNKALIIGPYQPDYSVPLGTAAGLLIDNIRKGRVPEKEGIVLLTSAAYRSQEQLGFEAALSAKKSQKLARQAYAVIEANYPELLKHLTILQGVTDLSTRKFFRVEEIER